MLDLNAFKLFCSLIQFDNTNFIVEPIEKLFSVLVREKDSAPGNGVRIEMSKFQYPFFYNYQTNTKLSYNQALLTLLNQLLLACTYRNEIAEGIKLVTSHRIFIEASSINGTKKDENTCVMVDEYFRPNFNISDPAIAEFANSLPIQPCSESSASKGVLTISQKPLYKAIGYYFNEGNYLSIYPNASNLSARLKSFVLPNSIRLKNPDKSVFSEYDENTLEMLVCLVKPGLERHVSGEIWIDNNSFKGKYFTQIKREWYNQTNLDEGSEVAGRDATIESIFGNLVNPKAVSIKCLERNPLYLRIENTFKVTESRITSNTGLKGYCSKQDNIGRIRITESDGSFSYINPQMVCGPSSMKAKVNGIRLMQAAYVARELGYPSESINSLDVNLINELADKAKPGVWISPLGEEIECYYGLINIALTDPSLQYSKDGYMSFPFEMLKLAMKEYPVLADKILASRDSAKMDVVKDIIYLQESLKGNCPTGFPVLNHNLFNSPKGKYQVRRINALEILPITNNYLLEKDRPAFVYQNIEGKKIYIPSTKTLEFFENTGNESINYDVLLVQLSRIFSRLKNLDGLINAVNRFILTTGNSIVLSPELYGVNFKQVTLYGYTRTISVPSSIYKSICKKLSKESGEDVSEVYAMTIRNPS